MYVIPAQTTSFFSELNVGTLPLPIRKVGLINRALLSALKRDTQDGKLIPYSGYQVLPKDEVDWLSLQQLDAQVSVVPSQEYPNCYEHELKILLFSTGLPVELLRHLTSESELHCFFLRTQIGETLLLGFPFGMRKVGLHYQTEKGLSFTFRGTQLYMPLPISKAWANENPLLPAGEISPLFWSLTDLPIRFIEHLALNDL